jgi:hypothetical protein
MATAEMQVGRSPEWVKTAKWTLFSDTKKAIEASMTEVKAGFAQLKKELAALAMPKLPAGTSDALMLDRKADVMAILAVQDSPVTTSLKAEEMCRQSVIDQDALTTFVLAGGPMSMFYQRAADKPVELESRLAEVSANGAAGAVLSWFRGSEGILAALTIADHAIFGELQDLEVQARSYTAPPWPER